jgi:hypothetical protein
VSGPRPAPQGDDTPLNPPDLDQPADDQVFYRRQEEVEDSDREFNDVAQYEGEPQISGGDGALRLDDLTDEELREGETSDPTEATEEGLTWVPPVDPPIVPDLDDPQGAKVAAGFGSSAEDDPYDRSHRAELLTAEDDTDARIREALLADAATSAYADSLVIGSRGGTIVVRGVVDDIDDTDNIVEVITRVTGVDEVIDELEVRGVTD